MLNIKSFWKYRHIKCSLIGSSNLLSHHSPGSMFASIFHAVNKHSSVYFPIVRTTQIELSFDLIISFLFQFISSLTSSLRMVYPIKCYNFPAENNISIIFRIRTYEWPLYPILSFIFLEFIMKIVDFFHYWQLKMAKLCWVGICRQTCLKDVIVKNVPAAFWALCI